MMWGAPEELVAAASRRPWAACVQRAEGRCRQKKKKGQANNPCEKRTVSISSDAMAGTHGAVWVGGTECTVLYVPSK